MKHTVNVGNFRVTMNTKKARAFLKSFDESKAVLKEEGWSEKVANEEAAGWGIKKALRA